MPEFSILIEILHFSFHHVRRLDRLARFERLVDHATGLEVSNLDPIESLPLARFDELVLDNGAGIAVHQNFQTGPEFISTVISHLYCSNAVNTATGHPGDRQKRS